MSISIVVGTRPEIIKMAPVMRELEKKRVPFTFILSGQHYDYEMSMGFIHDLKLPAPDYSFRLKNTKPASQIGEMMTKLEQALQRERTKLLCIQGDTNTMLAAAVTGVKLGLRIGHVEAGLRSYDWRMPEEHNRRMVDHVSDLLFAPTDRARRNLVQERVAGKVYVTGNTAIDSVLEHMPIAEERSDIIRSIIFREFALVTLHRAENVDDARVLKTLVGAFVDSPIPIVFPVHPRTRKRLEEGHLIAKLRTSGNVQLTKSLKYFDFLVLMKRCRIILTDSGGLQEEATAPCIRRPVLVLRASTERPEAVEGGFARVVGVDKMKILRALGELLANVSNLPRRSPFGDGNAHERIVRIIRRTR
jgi:UDP-N-acetylglucosamine 2-epimerase (non-hydrolysing)